jgi:hypothetical protein
MLCPFVAPQCRCEKSFLVNYPDGTPETLGLDNLRDSLIEPFPSGNADNPTAYEIMVEWLKDPTNEDKSDALADWFELYSTVSALVPSRCE